jgi:hypothetical protein
MVFLAGVLSHDGGPQFGIGLLNQMVAVVHGAVLKVAENSQMQHCWAQWLRAMGLRVGNPEIASHAWVQAPRVRLLVAAR